VVIPAPVLSEFLVFAGTDAPEYLVRIRESSTLRVEPFDERAAIELADIEIAARTKGNKRGSATTSEWQKVKFDRQIVAIAKAHGAKVIYSDDPDIKSHGTDCGITVLGLADLPLPPAVQEELFQQETTREPKQSGQETIAPGAPDEGSAPGPTAGEAGAETAEAKTKGEPNK